MNLLSSNNNKFFRLSSKLGYKDNYFNYSIKNLLNYFINLKVQKANTYSILGFVLFLTTFVQILSGITLAFSLLPEPSLIPIVREEEDLNCLNTDDFFWLHERGVDYLFLFMYMHILRKFYIGSFNKESEISWKSGFFVFLFYHVVVFFGLILCCTHLSEITLTIAANMFLTFFLFLGKPYWWIFTDTQLNTDTLLRLSYLHYITAIFMFILVLNHGIIIHYDWKNKFKNNFLTFEFLWIEELINFELMLLFLFYLNLFYFSDKLIFSKLEPLSYELFMWGDLSFISDIRFYGVAPHWYFRPYMSWLTSCPFHKLGLLGLVLIFILFYLQPNIFGLNFFNNYIKKVYNIFFFIYLNFIFFKNKLIKESKKKNTNLKKNFFFFNINFFFFFCLFYTFSFLPYGKFYNRLGGNKYMLFSYFFILIFFSFSFFRNFDFLKNFFKKLKYYII